MSDASVLIERRTRVGVTVQLLDRGVDDDEANRWETICVDHGGVCSHETRKLATAWLSHPDEWCEDCMYGVGTLDGSRVETRWEPCRRGRCEAGVPSIAGVEHLPYCDKRARWIAPSGALVCGGCKRLIEATEYRRMHGHFPGEVG